MLVLMLLPSLDEKGPIIVAKDIIKHSSNNNKYVIISLRKNNEALLKKYSDENFKVIEIGVGKIPVMNDIKKLNKIVKSLNPDIIHAHTFWPTLLLTHVKGRYKKIVTVHNNPIEDYSYEYGKIFGRIMTYIFNKKLDKYDVVVPISNYVKKELPKMLYSTIEVIYNGIEDNYIEREYKQSENDIELITVSVLNQRKNVIKILEIVKELKTRGNKVRCKVVGDGKELTNLKEFAKLKGIEKEIVFLGNLPREKVYENLLEADLFILTSKSEGFGLVVAEAMMMKKTVFVNDIPVMWEIINHFKDGFILDSNQSFVETIERCLNDKFKFDMGNKAREKYLNNFTVDKMASNYEQIYEKVHSMKVE